MGHCIQAIIGRPDTLRAVGDRFSMAQLVSLTQGFAMIPATDDLLDAVNAAYSSHDGSRFAGFTYLTEGMTTFLEELSMRGPVAYIETDYFGGAGAQAATAYVAGKAVLVEIESTATRWPINDAVRILGVTRMNSLDEFDALGLRRYRRMDEWE